MAEILIKNIKQLVTPKTGGKIGELSIIEDAAVFIRNGDIVKISHSDDLEDELVSLDQEIPFRRFELIDAENKVVLPGFVDAHTHALFYGSRENEFKLRIQGKSYEDITASGGGIHSSVRSLRRASIVQLVDEAIPRLNRFLSYGTTTIEIKSGYGLTLHDEIKSLRAIKKLRETHPLDIVPTFLGAHEIPEEYRYRRDYYIKIITDEMIPMVVDEKLAEFCDVFCEKGVFSIEETEKILLTAQRYGMKLKMHADELNPFGGAELASRLKVVSADHLLNVSDAGITLMKENCVIPVLLPGTAFFLNMDKYAPARKMIDTGLDIALSTDCNPGSCMTESMPMIITIACLKMKLTPSEALTASTLNSAKAILRDNIVGTIEEKKRADLVIWNVPNYEYIPYHFGVNLVDTVIKSGKVVYKSNYG
jgi:imidazolonepropionase